MSDLANTARGSWARDLALRAALLLALVAVASSAAAGSIFDEDWVPPVRKGIQPPTTPETTTPTTPLTTPTTQVVVPPKVDGGAGKTPPPRVVAPEPVTRVAAGRRPIPEKSAQSTSRKLFKEVFAKELADRSAAGRRALAGRLLDEAVKSADVPSDQFVLLVGATDAAREGGDLGLCVRASDALAGSYDVDALQVKSDAALKMSLRADTPAVNAQNVHAGLALVDQLAAADDYAPASRLLAGLRAPAANDPKLTATVQARTHDVEAMRAAYDRLPGQITKLKTSPDDPAANLAYGKFLCLMKGDWDRGMPMLAKGTDGPLKAAAALDAAGPADSGKQVEAGDAWWAAAEKEAGPGQTVLRQRAAHWYTTALAAGTVSGLSRTRLEQRIAQATPKAAPSATPSGTATAAPPTAGGRSVLMLRSKDTDEHYFKEISGGKIKLVTKAEAPAVLADPATYSSVTIVVFGPNRWKDLKPADLTDAVRLNLVQFVRGGGDLIMFEQGGGNMEIFDATFGIKTRSAYMGAKIPHPALMQKAKAAGITDGTLERVPCWDSFDDLPKGSTVLLTSGRRNSAVIVPIGPGHLVLMGLDVDPPSDKLVEVILDLIYGYKASK